MKNDYVHGYSNEEATRLHDQAKTLSDLLHNNIKFPAGSRVLEAGCGVGAQTILLAKNSPDAQIISIDLFEESLNQARSLIKKEGIKNVEFVKADIMDLPFEKESFDHIFVCFVLEHTLDPIQTLKKLNKVLKPGGTITVIEGDHGSCYFHPESEQALKTWKYLIKAQKDLGGDPLLGRKLYPILSEAGFEDIVVTPLVVYVDNSQPHMGEGFIKKTIIAMVEGLKNQAIDSGIIKKREWDQGMEDLHKSAEKDGTFFYNFFKAVARK
ncbi:methyltransferase domain-containing protein [Methanobacterium alkalithermotolerans]|uniref:Methyltransferase domain-containing protein n=1 Tax=Methanobacterium alkalithermotolerans TaxID=2731220 RepID=A0A8T8K414_9EURY|nr:methyltransferase domain-containing protein [Methanobacterium alkalithermotolerans]QUH23268.1 methyltransferase domain-containing protein [Methanobacterium alkalithermotolerans]